MEVVDRVRSALSNPQWDFRTIGGIARDTELSREQVERVLADHQDLFGGPILLATAHRSTPCVRSRRVCANAMPSCATLSHHQ